MSNSCPINAPLCWAIDCNCDRTANQQNKPQDNQKVEEKQHILSRPQILFRKEEAMHDCKRGSLYHPYQIFEAMEEYASQFKSHIAELEKQNEQYREALEEVQSNYRCGHRVITGKIIDMVKQALNPKVDG